MTNSNSTPIISGSLVTLLHKVIDPTKIQTPFGKFLAFEHGVLITLDNNQELVYTPTRDGIYIFKGETPEDNIYKVGSLVVARIHYAVAICTVIGFNGTFNSICVKNTKEIYNVHRSDILYIL